MGLISRHKIKKLRIPSIEAALKQTPEDRVFYLRFYNPISKGEWLVWGADIYEKDVRFYGRVTFNNTFDEYFLLSELRKIKLPFGFKIVWDEVFKYEP